MNMKFLPLLSVTLTLALALLTGCRQEQAAPEADPVAAPVAATEVLPRPLPEPNPIDATSVIDHGLTGDASAQAGALDTKALAGSFRSSNSLLELGSDGTYVQTMTIDGAPLEATGTWSATGPATVLLDPNSKSAADAVFLVASNDQLNSEDGELTFRRITAP